MGKNIFEQGEFNSYRVDSLSHSMKPIYESYDFAQKKTSVFLSHKHDDLNDLKGVSLCQVPKHWEYNIFQSLCKFRRFVQILISL